MSVSHELNLNKLVTHSSPLMNQNWLSMKAFISLIHLSLFFWSLATTLVSDIGPKVQQFLPISFVVARHNSDSSTFISLTLSELTLCCKSFQPFCSFFCQISNKIDQWDYLIIYVQCSVLLLCFQLLRSWSFLYALGNYFFMQRPNEIFIHDCSLHFHIFKDF